ncbi:MAG TPA: hypothetical protein VEG42_04200, partial [Thermoplasmata archaeon]|nr:hypothetical protein [Thermoplasmata archaeon]
MPGIWALAVVVLVVVSSLGLLALLSPIAANPVQARPASSSSGTTPAATITHGDLVIGPGQTFVIQPTLAGPTYYQGGNITVLAGGTLDVLNVTLSFVQFVGYTGTAQQRVSHILHFVDQGTVNFYKANLTTDVNVINAFPKLNFTVQGDVNAWGSTFAFPGWIYEEGASAAITLNQSVITWNTAVNGLLEPTAILGDTLWAPTIS